ncbi:MAG: TMEM14 family protein [Blastocatellia bacterium]
MISFVPVYLLVYGAMIMLGGVMGYVKAKSQASLIAGLVAGALLDGSAALMIMGSRTAGWWLALLVSLALLARFGMAAMKDFKMMPGGMVIALSLAAIVILLLNRT